MNNTIKEILAGSKYEGTLIEWENNTSDTIGDGVYNIKKDAEANAACRVLFDRQLYIEDELDRIRSDRDNIKPDYEYWKSDIERLNIKVNDLIDELHDLRKQATQLQQAIKED